MRWLTVLVVVVGLAVAGLADGRAPSPPAARAQPVPTGTATATREPPPETPIVDPEPLPVPVHLPWVALSDSAALPPPLTPGVSGYVAGLDTRGRQACAPGTHALLEDREGALNNRVVAMLYQELPAPALTLDLFVGDFVSLWGTESTTPPTCRTKTSRLIGVRHIERVVRPPGGW